MELVYEERCPPRLPRKRNKTFSAARQPHKADQGRLASQGDYFVLWASQPRVLSIIPSRQFMSNRTITMSPKLPVELIDLVAECVESDSDLNSMAQADSRLCRLLCPRLYLQNQRRSHSSALVWAAMYGYIRTAKNALVAMLTASVDMDLCYALHLVAIDFGRTDIVQLMRDRIPALLGYQPRVGFSALCFFAEQDCHDAFRILLRSPAVDLEPADTLWPPVSNAARLGHVSIVQLLLNSRRVNINVADRYGQTPLALAAWEGRDDVVKLLLSHKGVDVNLQDSAGRTALHRAAWHHTVPVMATLINSGKVDVNLKDGRGQRPLAIVACSGVHIA